MKNAIDSSSPRSLREVIVLQHEHQALAALVQFLHQQREGTGGQLPGATAERPERAAPGAGSDLRHGRYQETPESRRVGVARVQRHPGKARCVSAGLHPLRQQRRLAVASRGADQGQDLALSRP